MAVNQNTCETQLVMGILQVGQTSTLSLHLKIRNFKLSLILFKRILFLKPLINDRQTEEFFGLLHTESII